LVVIELLSLLVMLLSPPRVSHLASRISLDSVFDPIVDAGIREGVYPGAALVIGRHDTVLFAKAYGHLTWRSQSPAVSVDDTFWDLASLTKVVATTPSLMLLVERGKVGLDTPVVRYIPEFNGPGTAAITVRHLLTHTSGLRGTLLLRDAPDSATALRMVFTTTPVVAPGSRMVYSDLNAILLGEIVQRVSGQPLDLFVTREVYVPLGLDQQMMFRPPKRLEPRIAPTGLWHGHPVAGIVNDPNAARLGGVAGHAGLFATAAALRRYAQFMLLEGSAPPGGPRILKRETVRQFTQVAVAARRGAGARTLGWEALPTGEEVSSAGTLLGPRSYGHTGWTGTSLWIDPDRDLFILLLTNRAFDPRTRRSFTKLHEIRGRVADAATRAADASH
jgi:CubicO group peptidase (beta-lactamase class C family)